MTYTFDHNLFLWLNFDGGEFFDSLMLAASNPLAWSWLYVLILYFVWKKSSWKGIALFIVATGWALHKRKWIGIALFIIIAGMALGMSDLIAGIFKHSGPLKHVWAEFPARLRPMHTPELQDAIHFVTRGGKYGTVSAHAATTMALAVVSSTFVRRWWMIAAMVAMTLIICYSRIYLAYHFPFDILLGLITGLCSIGISIYIVKGATWCWGKLKANRNQ